jgi:hypothetical protein
VTAGGVAVVTHGYALMASWVEACSVALPPDHDRARRAKSHSRAEVVCPSSTSSRP